MGAAEPLAGVSATLLKSSPIPFLELFDFCRNISLGAAVFLGLTHLILHGRQVLYRGKKVNSGPTWRCGFTRPTPRIQYTGSSFGAPLLDFFRTIAPRKEEYGHLKGPFPEPASYHSFSEDRAEKVAAIGVAQPVLRTL